ncbi:MAG: ABC transporter ATP-binding protein [Acidimicrobiia bacterium]
MTALSLDGTDAADAQGGAALRLEHVDAGYGDSIVLRDISLSVGRGEVVALLGPNGAGKTTLLRTATGVVRPRSGRVFVDEDELTGRPPHAFVRRGVCHLPEGRGIFPSLTVKENLTIQARGRPLRDVVEEATELFPVLGSRLSQTAGSLSGGEQQMLALSRAYITSPSIVLADEASLGLAPLLVDKIYEALAQLVERGLSVVVVEQYVQKALDLASTVYILSRGEVVHHGSARDLSPAEIYERYLGIEAGS